MLKFRCFSPFLIHVVKGGVESSRNLTVWYSEAAYFIVQYDSLLGKCRWVRSGVSQHLHSDHRRHSVSWFNRNETVFHGNAVGSRTPRPQFPSPRVKVLRSWLQTSCLLTYGWLRSPDRGKESLYVIILPGAQRDSHFTNSDILAQVTTVMDIPTPTMIISSSSTTPQLTSNGQIPRFLHRRYLWVP